jgi:signal transduction histidine kinase
LFVIFEALFALIVGVLNFYFLKSIIDPVNKINKIAKFIAEGDFSARVKREHDDELGKLCDSVNYMAKELGAAEKTKNDFISSISHELRTPLTSIRGWAEILKNSDVLDFKIMKKAMEVIVNESTRLCSIVEELLDFSSLKNSRLVLNMAKIDVIAELSEAVYIFCKRAEHEKKTFFYIEPEDFPIVFGDKNRLKQVFTNIIDNALKYTEDGKGVISIFTKTQDDFVKITIEDNGCGISEEDLPRIKEKFFKANKTQIGAGIGLALANEIVLAHSGKINIKSQENIGTVVTIFIPISSSDDKHQHIENR